MLLLFFKFLFWSSFCCICCQFFSAAKKSLTIFIAQLCANVFSKIQKSIFFYIYSIFRFNWISYFYKMKWLYYLITRVKFILPSISNGLLIWSVNHTSMAWNSELYVFKKIWFFGEISNKLLSRLSNHFYIWLFHFQCFQAISLFRVLKAQDNIQF